MKYDIDDYRQLEAKGLEFLLIAAVFNYNIEKFELAHVRLLPKIIVCEHYEIHHEFRR